MSGRRVRDRAFYLRERRVGVGHGSTTKLFMHDVFFLNARFGHKKKERKEDGWEEKGR